MTTTTDSSALLRAILTDPFEDTVRLAYADWLGENGEAERAEFIRVQCELEILRQQSCSVESGAWDEPLISGGKPTPAWPKSPPARCCMPKGEYYGGKCHKCARIDALLRRERELLLGADGFNIRRWSGECWKRSPEFRRGFVSEIRLPLAAFTEGIAKTIFGQHPVTRVVLTDQEPYAFPQSYHWVYEGDDRAGLEAGNLPYHLFRLLPRVISDTEDDALDALSLACVNYGRSLVGLPPLNWDK